MQQKHSKKPNEIVSEMPPQYPGCISTDCPQRETCLRSFAWNHHDADRWFLSVVNPDMTSTDGHCQYYSDSKPQRYARGFTNFQKRMYPDQYDQFKELCIERFGRNQYFMRRRGATPIPPSEQEFIKEMLKKVGAPDDLDFEEYEYRLNWDAD